MPLLNKLLKELNLTQADLAGGNSHVARLIRTDGVEATEEFDRVSKLPRRPENPADDPEAVALAAALTRRYGTPGMMDMRPWQARAIGDAHDYGGCLAAGPVGIGKTLVSYMAGAVCSSTNTNVLLLIPAKLVEKTERDFDALSKIWRGRVPHIRTYAELGLQRGDEVLKRVLPSFIIADEVHKLSNLEAGVTRKIERYLQELEQHGAEARLLLMSGTILEGGVSRFHHLLRWCTGEENCPLPSKPNEAAFWGRAVDVKVRDGLRVSPGVLGSTTEEAREWVTSRIRSARGVAWAPAPEVKANLRIRVWSPKLPWKLEQAIAQANDGRDPTGAEFETEDDQGRCLRTLPLGFYRRWTEAPHPEWLKIRRRYFAFVRDRLAERIPGVDTELQVRTRFATSSPTLMWRDVQDQYPEPPREAVWLDHGPMLDIEAEARRQAQLVWTWYREPGEFLQAGMKYYGEQGLDAGGNFIEDDPSETSCCASQAANSEGRNLQHRWHRNLILTQSGSASMYEQLLGRTYRPGQEADTVYATIYAPTERAKASFASAVAEAKAHGGMLLARADFE